MATKLCCTAETESRAGSPDLPIARISEATPAKRPLLSKRTPSRDSRFTSARSEDLHELRQIFDNATDHGSEQASPPKPHRARINRGSVYSLHSLHKMKSMHSIIRRKFSRDLSKKPSAVHLKGGKLKRASENDDPATVVKQPRDGPNQQFNITKADLKKDLLSDKKPEDGGYDSDAEVLNDIAKNIGKKMPSKRPSIHSVDWTPSTSSKPTPGSSSKGRQSPDRSAQVQPYQISHPRATTVSAPFSHVFSTPNLRLDPSSSPREHKLRRSHSATSIKLPTPSPLSPLRLPSLTTHDQDGVPWSVFMNESLRLSQFPVPPHTVSHKQSKRSLQPHLAQKGPLPTARTLEPATQHSSDMVEIRVQEPTSISTPRESASIRGTIRENAPSSKLENSVKLDNDEDGEGNPRRSVHLYSMRISHHLRSGSLLSWDNLADAPELPVPPRPLRQRTVSDQSRISQLQRQHMRHDRESSSSGFASSKVPSRWGNVLSQENEAREDIASSIYSSRPQSQPESVGGSIRSVARSVVQYGSLKNLSLDPAPQDGSNIEPTDNEDTPRPAQRYSIIKSHSAAKPSTANSLLAIPAPLIFNNSVSNNKKSKFREEFSPPPKKKVTTSAAIMHFLNPKRSSIRSQSEANLKAEVLKPAVDGSLEVPYTSTERPMSRSMVSLHADQKKLGKDKAANPVWERALKAHQNERASFFLPENKELAVHGSPYRERSASVGRSSHSIHREHPAAIATSTSKRFSAPTLEPRTFGGTGPEYPPALSSRRTAFVARSIDDISPCQEVQNAFDQQSETGGTVGAWGRYPSHTRPERTSSAGRLDSVETRDFALEAAIRFAAGRNSNGDEDVIDPSVRPRSPPLIPGEKRRKKRIGSSRMAKSHSMTFGKTFLKNYAKIFKSQSTEFQRHGHGHRSSVTTGGMLEYPELEILPDVWRRAIVEERSADGVTGKDEHSPVREEYNSSDKKGKGKLRADISMATLRPRKPSSEEKPESAAMRLDGSVDSEDRNDSARVWSVYYETCIPSYPRASTEIDLTLEDFGGPIRFSIEGKHASTQTRTLPARLTKHSRNGSRMSRISIVSHNSTRPSFISGEEDAGIEERSIVSVRRSTMDLVNIYKEQEVKERERVLSLMRAESMRESAALAGL